MPSKRALAFALALAPVAVWAVACSGSDSSGSGLFDAGSDVTSGDDGGGTGDDASVQDSGGGGQDSGSKDVNVKETAPPFDAGQPVILDGGPDYEGGVPCVVGGTLEVEPNGDPGQANALAGSVCGSITPITPTADVDYYKFTLSQSATKLTIYFNADIKMTIAVPGHPDTVITSTNSPAVPFDTGKEYTVKVETNNGQKQNYILTLVTN